MLEAFRPKKTGTSDELVPSRTIADAEEVLEAIGYKQELKRSLGLLSMIGFTFSILASWLAVSGSLAAVMQNGGPCVLVFGWIGCCAFSMCVVIVLAELCSAYPVAGGQYSWCLLLARDTNWGRGVSYACGWIQLSGMVGMQAVGSYQFGLMICAAVTMNIPSFVPKNWIVALVAYASVFFALTVSLLGQRIMNSVSTAALFCSVGSFIICTATILACADKLQSPSFVFTSTVHEGWSNLGMSVILGLMQPAFSMCAYDSVAHLAEETDDATRQSPRAMILSVIIGFLTGLGFILALLFSIQDMDAVLSTNTGMPALEIFRQATNNKVGSTCLTVLAFTCQMFANISLTTNVSRSIYAFARDGAFPYRFNKWFGSVSHTLDVPVYAMLLAVGVTCVLITILFGSSTAFFTVMSIASTGLYASYLFPIVVYMICKEKKVSGYYNLRKWALWFQIPAVLYLTFCIIFFFFPTQVPVTGNNMNYTIAAFGIVLILGLVSWFGGAKITYIHEVGVLQAEILELNQQSSSLGEKDKELAKSLGRAR